MWELVELKQRYNLFLVILLVLALGVYAQPQPVTQSNLTTGTPETRSAGSAGSMITQGGNITELNITAQTQTQFWQGVWGQIALDLVLQDATGNIFYNWTRFNVTAGEVYFSNNSAQIFDSSITNATDGNISYAQTVYNWANSTGSDNFTNTYRIAHGHQQFSFRTTGGFDIQINASTAPSVNLQGGLFNSTVLWDADFGGYPLWVSIVSADATAFNNRQADFEILLPVQGSLATQTYYVYAEIN